MIETQTLTILKPFCQPGRQPEVEAGGHVRSPTRFRSRLRKLKTAAACSKAGSRIDVHCLSAVFVDFRS